MIRDGGGRDTARAPAGSSSLSWRRPVAAQVSFVFILVFTAVAARALTRSPTDGSGSGSPTVRPTATATPVEIVPVELGTRTISGLVYDARRGTDAPISDARITYELRHLGIDEVLESVVTKEDGRFQFDLHLYDVDFVTITVEARHHGIHRQVFRGIELWADPNLEVGLYSFPVRSVEIRGTVLDASQSARSPVAGAEVRYTLNAVVHSTESGLTHSDADGNYALAFELYSGDIVELSAHASGFRPDIAKAKAIWLKDKEDHFDFLLLPEGALPGHQISGRLSCSGVPTPTPGTAALPSLTITLLPAGRSTVSDHTDSFDFFYVPDGSYRLQIAPNRDDAAPCAEVPVTVAGANVFVEICPDLCRAHEPPATATPTPTVTEPSCVGDVDGNGAVAINELVMGVNIALGSHLLAEAPTFDVNANAAVEVNEIVLAVQFALRGCP